MLRCQQHDVFSVRRLTGTAQRLALTFSLFLFAGGECPSAEISASTSDGTAFILVRGRLEKGDQDRFSAEIGPYPKGIVILESDGGNMLAGLAIGETIRMRGFVTFVDSRSRCASACAIAWLGGAKRFMGIGAQIGFHAASDPSTGQESGMGNALVGAYLTRIGLPVSAVLYITQASPDSMTWLSLSAAKSKGIDVSLFEPPSTAQPGTQPQPLPPQPITPSLSGNLEQSAQEFVSGLIGLRSSDDTTKLEPIYSDEVNYEGSRKTRKAVLDERRKFYAAWPQRKYIVLPGTMNTSCDKIVNECATRGTSEWLVYSAQRNIGVNGLAAFDYKLELLQGRFRVTAENWSVVSRQSTKISNAVQIGIETFLNTYEQMGIAGLVAEAVDCWSIFNIQMTSAKAESCFSLDYATSLMDSVASERSTNAYTPPDRMAARAKTALEKLNISPERAPSLLKLWTMAADHALSAGLAAKKQSESDGASRK
jgi:hypothetical protein